MSDTALFPTDLIYFSHQMVAVPGYGFVSASVDYNLRMWHEDGNVSHILKSTYIEEY